MGKIPIEYQICGLLDTDVATLAYIHAFLQACSLSIARKLVWIESSDGLFVLGIGTTDDVFQASGSLRVLNDKLKGCVSVCVITSAVPFSICPEMPSGPDALVT